MKKIALTLIVFFFVTNLSAQIEVKSTGVGIGTTNPQYTLDVNGDARVAGNIYLRTSGLGVGIANPQYPLDVSGNARIAGDIYLESTGRMGIGTLNPQYPLDVTGDARIAGNIYLRSTGVGIGVFNPQHTLDVGGNIRAGGIYANSMTSTSSNAITFKVHTEYAGYTGSSAFSNVSFGYQALNVQGGTGNVAIGCVALSSNTAGNYNTATGQNALSDNTTGHYNTATGQSAMRRNTIGSSNTANGRDALGNNSAGSSNTATGYSALSANTTGNSNTAIGYYALRINNIGAYNTAAGIEALYYNTQGSNNAAVGNQALVNNTTGDHNIGIGYRALYHNSTGSQNIAIGDFATVNVSNLNNAIAIGAGAVVTASNQARIGNSTMTSIGGQVAWSTLSDGRSKKNIQPNVPGLSFINRLQPVTYNLDLDAIDVLLNIDQMRSIPDSLVQPLPQELIDRNNKARAAKEKEIQTGFVAQDVETIAKSLGFDFSGVEVDESGIYSLRYGEFVVPLVKAVQELSEQNERLQKQITELTALVNKLLGSEKVSEAASVTQGK